MKRDLGMFGQFLWFCVVATVSFAAGYWLLVKYWPFGYLPDPLYPTPLDWHAVTARYLLMAKPGLSAPDWLRLLVNPTVPLAERLAVVRWGYQTFFSYSWFAGVALVECLALLTAFYVDHTFVWQRVGEGSKMTRKHITLGCFTWFALTILLFFAAFLAQETNLAKTLRGLGFRMLSWGCLLAPVAWFLRRLLRPSRPGQGMSDVRQLAHALQPRKPFDPARYFDPRKGVFIGLAGNQPVYVPWFNYRTQHKQITGTTGTGKGVVAAVMLSQSIRAGESVIVIDPKDDSKMPGVLAREANAAGVPFTLVDLRSETTPQLNLFAGATPSQVQKLLVSGLDLGRKGGDSDYYAGQDQDAADEVAAHASAAGFGMPYIRNAFSNRFTSLQDPKTKVAGEKFWRSLRQLARVPSLNITTGVDLQAAVEQPGVLYVIGDTNDEQLVIVQKMLLFRLMQLIRERDRDREQYVTVLLDELRFILSNEVLNALATIRDYKCHVMLCHQSLQDLRNCGALDPQAVYGAVVENTALKILYQVKSPDTAQWGSRLSGSTTAYVSSEHMDTTLSGNRGSWQEKQRPLIEENVLLHLPAGMGVLYGVGAARIIQVCPLPMGPRPVVYTAPAEVHQQMPGLVQLAQAVDSQMPAPPASVPQPLAAPNIDEEI
ncbi:MAG TPA: type IV secretory system conjugative DNA transfer family protein [Terracidiphilus sp.]|jgi:hypothetical protein|nr:type IV secretory system conjugative DNA transfer family protein [Terracidiphilus sp.]